MKSAIRLLTAVILLGCANHVFAGDLKIPIPQRGISTPTQKLNREGVAELKHGHRDKAKKLFYRAYLLDPNDPFTLNNLGYVAELDGDADRALRFYALAAKDHTDAIIDQSSEAALKGRPLDDAFRQVKDANHEISKINEQAIVLLQDGRAFEARGLLRSMLQRHPDDPFLLNNLGYTMEALGDLDGALRYYSAAASLHSKELVVVTPRPKWRGKPVSEIAADNAKAVNDLISRGEGVEAAAARLNLRGVAALNDNNPSAARDYFQQAYKRDSQNAFTLNNLGYISELGGDWEGAQEFYEAARSGRDANGRVNYSTRRDVEGEKIDTVADDNHVGASSAMQAMQQARRRSGSPIELLRRDGTPATTAPEPAKPVPPVGIQPPPLPALPPPDSEQNRQPSQSTPPQNPPQNPN
jgi:Flp pilus assembly protein TadD